MLRAWQVLAAISVLLGCSQGPGGNAPWLSQTTRDEHTSRFFPISTGPHAVECNVCHGVSTSFRTFDCVTCHEQVPTASMHRGVPGYLHASQACFDCHRDGAAIGQMDHTSYFPIAPGEVHALEAPAVHAEGAIACASCHTSRADRTRLDCVTCHPQPAMAPLHLDVPDLKFTAIDETSASCVKCHADSRAPIAAGDTHALGAAAVHLPGGISCTSCHTTAASRKVECTLCHDAADQSATHDGLLAPSAVNAPLGNDLGGTPGCLLCHAGGALQRVATH